jgi:hypothetical protein
MPVQDDTLPPDHMLGPPDHTLTPEPPEPTKQSGR